MYTAELESPERLVRLVKDAVCLICEQVQNDWPQLCKVEAARVAATVAQAATEPRLQLLTASESGLKGKVGQLA